MTTVQYPWIAFIGGMGTGKSAAAKLLEDHYGYTRVSFADPLKVMAGAHAKREVLQDLGVGVRALTGGAGWINLMREHLDNELPLGARVVVDDCRFPNEVDFLRGEGFVIVKMHATLTDRVARLTANGKWTGYEALAHESETALADVIPDHGIMNAWDKDALLEELTKILNHELR